MRTGTGWFLISILCLLSAGTVASPADEAKITAYNPRGIQPLIRRIPMAERPATLDGKTVYIVDTKYPRTREFVDELVKILKERRPKTNWVLKDKFGGYMDDDPKLWAEIKEHAQAAIVLIGH